MLLRLVVGDRAEPEPLRVVRRDREDVVEQRRGLAREIPAAGHRDRLGQLPERLDVVRLEFDGTPERGLGTLELLDSQVASSEQAPAFHVPGLASQAFLETQQELADRRCPRGAVTDLNVRAPLSSGARAPGGRPRSVRRHAARAALAGHGARIAEVQVQGAGRQRHEHRHERRGRHRAVADRPFGQPVELGGQVALELGGLALVRIAVERAAGEGGGERLVPFPGERDVGGPEVGLARGRRPRAQGAGEQQSERNDHQQRGQQEEEGHATGAMRG